MGCGLACVAFLVGRSYREVHENADNPQNARSKGYLCSHLVKELQKYGVSYSWKKVSPTPDKPNEISPGSILFIKRSTRYPDGHFVVMTDQGTYMNPWINLPYENDVQAGFQFELEGVIEYVISPA